MNPSTPYLSDLDWQIKQIIGTLQRLRVGLRCLNQDEQTASAPGEYQVQAEHWYGGSELTDTGYTYAELAAALKRMWLNPECGYGA